jgi:hypothetical protein
MAGFGINGSKLLSSVASGNQHLSSTARELIM